MGKIDKTKYYSYSDLKLLVIENKVTTQKDYETTYKNLDTELKAPMNPRTFYGVKNWNGWGDFLNTEIRRKKFYNIFYSYNEFKHEIQKLGIKSKNEYFKKIKQLKNKDERMPSNPALTYKNDWVNWGQFLGTNRIANQNAEYISFNEAKIWARSLNFTMEKEWKKLTIDDLPIGIPKVPQKIYKNSGWVGWSDFLGVNKSTKMSYGEKKIYDFLIKNNIDFKYDKNIKGCNHKCQLRFDFQIMKRNICIEFDGEQHFKAKKYYGGEEEFIKTKKRDEIKNLFCDVNNIKLIRLSYNLKDSEIYETLKKELLN